jgi:hypothetical protein
MFLNSLIVCACITGFSGPNFKNFADANKANACVGGVCENSGTGATSCQLLCCTQNNVASDKCMKSVDFYADDDYCHDGVFDSCLRSCTPPPTPFPNLPSPSHIAGGGIAAIIICLGAAVCIGVFVWQKR